MGTRLHRLGEAVLTSTHNLVLSINMKITRIFLKVFGGKLSIYLNKCVFVMRLGFSDAIKCIKIVKKLSLLRKPRGRANKR